MPGWSTSETSAARAPCRRASRARPAARSPCPRPLRVVDQHAAGESRPAPVRRRRRRPAPRARGRSRPRAGRGPRAPPAAGPGGRAAPWAGRRAGDRRPRRAAARRPACRSCSAVVMGPAYLTARRAERGACRAIGLSLRSAQWRAPRPGWRLLARVPRRPTSACAGAARTERAGARRRARGRAVLRSLGQRPVTGSDEDPRVAELRTAVARLRRELAAHPPSSPTGASPRTNWRRWPRWRPTAPPSSRGCAAPCC